MPMQIWKITHEQLRAAGRSINSFIRTSDLMKYGFTDEVVESLLRFEIFPNRYVIQGDVYIHRQDLHELLSKFIMNNIKLYETVELEKAKAAEAKQVFESNTFPLSPEDFERMNSGEIGLTALLLEKKASGALPAHVEIPETEEQVAYVN
jgi:hypothetical protein